MPRSCSTYTGTPIRGPEVGGGPSALNVLVSNGDFVVALHRSQKMCTRVLRGKDDADAIIGDDLNLRRKTPELARMQFTIVASDFDEAPPARWKPVPDKAVVTLVRGEDPKVEAL